MEFEKKAKIMEKSWKFKISIWKNHGKKFWRSAHSIHCQQIVYAIITVPTFIMGVVCDYKEMQGDHIQSKIVCFISVKISHCCGMSIMEKSNYKYSWKIKEKSWNLIPGKP